MNQQIVKIIAVPERFRFLSICCLIATLFAVSSNAALGDETAPSATQKAGAGTPPRNRSSRAIRIPDRERYACATNN